MMLIHTFSNPCPSDHPFPPPSTRVNGILNWIRKDPASDANAYLAMYRDYHDFCSPPIGWADVGQKIGWGFNHYIMTIHLP